MEQCEIVCSLSKKVVKIHSTKYYYKCKKVLLADSKDIKVLLGEKKSKSSKITVIVFSKSSLCTCK